MKLDAFFFILRIKIERSAVMVALASLRVSTKCPRCEMPLVMPEWSECISDNETIHCWHCPVCGKEFKTVDGSVAPTVPSEVAGGDCFTCLLVA